MAEKMNVGLSRNHTLLEPPWISIPSCSMFVISLLDNGILLYMIKTGVSLHKPMFFFLSMLFSIDLLLSLTPMSKTLGIFWFNAGEIGLVGCLVQMFFLHSFSIMESAVLLAKSFDRYVAICHPLRYHSILTHSLVVKAGLMVLMRAVALVLPLPFLLQRLPSGQLKANTIAHTYCEHMAVVKLACSSILSNVVYGLLVALLVVGADLLLITFSYCMITRAVLALPSRDARYKAFSTCAAHVVILVSYTLALFTILTHRFGHVLPHVHILLANFYLLFPPMLNPIVYGVKTKEIRDQVHEFHKHSNHSQPIIAFQMKRTEKQPL
uniref:G-protein coupled receptors family 1 profile domain-containing protein n=1 Tax=Laticauda laticaudata TaxID=8630 RepID=A0A8C5RXR4_LATLA